jgi:hypothetical protein
MQDLVIYKHETTSSIKDIGAAIVRTATRFENGAPLKDRVHSMAPIVSGRDILRNRKHSRHMKDFTNFCTHKGGDTLRTDRVNSDGSNCKCQEYFEVTTAIDSVYYPGVLEEMAIDSIVSKGVGYVAFNDYDAAWRKNGNKGRCADDESQYFLYGDIVESTVRGNVAPYVHGFLRTTDRISWQYKMNFQSIATTAYVIFEVYEGEWNAVFRINF